MNRFSLSTIFWVMLLAAVLIAWYLERSSWHRGLANRLVGTWRFGSITLTLTKDGEYEWVRGEFGHAGEYSVNYDVLTLVYQTRSDRDHVSASAVRYNVSFVDRGLYLIEEGSRTYGPFKLSSDGN